MFAKYTDGARRIVFYARAAVSQYSATHIELEHILLGVIQVSFSMLSRLIGPEAVAALRTETEQYARLRAGDQELPTSADVPLSNEAMNVVKNVGLEAERINSSIGEEDLIAALLQEEGYVADLMKKHGLTLEAVRSIKCDKNSPGEPGFNAT